MATAEQIKSLLRSYSDADGDTFVSVALQIAAHEAKNGKGSLAAELKGLVNDIREKQRSAKIGGAVPISRPSGELANLLSASYPQNSIFRDGSRSGSACDSFASSVGVQTAG